MHGVEAQQNFPTVSSPTVMQDYPGVRDNERDVLLEYVTLRPGMQVLDVQAAGGYLSDEVHRRLGGDVINLCVEPNPELRARLDPAYVVIDNPVERFDDIADASVDVALGLIGLHHSHSHRATLGESVRVLKPGGELAFCDVPAGSRLAAWLNEFVDAHCPAGHTGNFPEIGSLRAHCQALGCEGVTEELRDVPWIFPNRQAIVAYFQGLFGLTAEAPLIDEALEDYFTLRERGGKVWVDWQLLYCHAIRPRGRL